MSRCVLQIGRSCSLMFSLIAGSGLGAANLITVSPTGSAYTTIQSGINAAQPGDTVSVAPGIYRELVNVNKGITVEGAAGAIIDGSGLSTSGDGLVVVSASNANFKGFEVRNFSTTSTSNTPVGIRVAPGISHITLANNVIHHITTAETSSGGNAHGIAVYGESATANTDINILGNEIHSCKLGHSESLVINGNVDGWVVSGNYVHDNDNIGIDAIGYEGVGPSGYDRARNGKIVGNTVKNISSANNPAYGTNEHAADGIYVDGGANILIEGNRVDQCDIGIELASEHQGKNTSDVIIRNNFVSRSYQANILMGGYASDRGNAVNISVFNNTTFHGGSGDGNGEICLQYHCSNVTIKNNVLYGNAGQDYIQQSGSSNTGVIVANNLYFGASTSSTGVWADSNPEFADPKFVNAPSDLHLQVGSPAIDAGLNLGTLSGSVDIDGKARVQGSAIDLGADEFNANTVSYTIIASAGSGGTITPSGSVNVSQGANQTFTITPAMGYAIASVLVDGVNVGAVASYTFSNVQVAHSIQASFKVVSTSYTINASAGSGGTISPSGSVNVAQGTSRSFTITPATGYAIASVLVDGVNVGAVASYTFSNVQAAHSIQASFKVLSTTDTNIAPSGIGYVWSQNSYANSNNHRVAKAGLNDGNISTSFSVYGYGDIDNGYEAAGIVFASPRSISSVSFINGSITNGDGYLEAGICLQISLDGITWTSTTPSGWALVSAYPYNYTAGGKTYTFKGPRLSNVKGIRVCGRVVVVPESYFWRLKEFMVFGR